MNVLRDMRQNIVRDWIGKSGKTKILDVGSGSYPIHDKATTLDIQESKKPDFISSVIDMPFDNGCFDCVSCLEVIEHFERREQIQALREIRRILSKDGIAIFSIPNSSKYLDLAQKWVWFAREHTTQKEYHGNQLTHAHIGLVSPKMFIEMLEKCGFSVILQRKFLIYDFLVVCKPTS